MKNIFISLFSILFIFACSSVETVDVQETKTVDLTSSESDSGSSMSEVDIGLSLIHI